ncbi:hypothetical protein [Nostoc sp. CMAA1605]|uniref:hypothetical protein n=1 Tax=Nostoc sp. CMAA1605 TaxID=2055159 RepID=UPI001F434CF6|nr:hypothetical protein [Nostoc sp. CMAA1605]MCF4969196.1 hypothetical protein [Nostoc sp. CMAA1605]
MSPIRAVVVAFIVISALVAWWKSGLKCPIYIHVLGGLATALGVLIVQGIEPEMPINQWWLLGKWWIVLITPAFVYGGFAVYGGAIYSKKD